MRSVIYSMGVSLDGYIVGPDGDIAAPPPDEEVWRLVTDEILPHTRKRDSDARH